MVSLQTHVLAAWFINLYLKLQFYLTMSVHCIDSICCGAVWTLLCGELGSLHKLHLLLASCAAATARAYSVNKLKKLLQAASWEDQEV